MKVLIVGAGSVGQVLGAHLQAGGVQVEFLVKPAYATFHDRHAMVLQQLSFLPSRKYGRTVLQDYVVHASMGAVRSSAAAAAYTAVILTFASTDLHAGAEYIRELRAAVGEATTLVLLTIGLTDRSFLTDTCGVPEDVLVQAAITMISWPAPLPGEAYPVMPPLLAPITRAGRKRAGLTSDDMPMDTSESSARDHHVLPTAYVLPSAMPFFGPAHRIAPLLAGLNAGGLPAAAGSPLQLQFLSVMSAGLQMLVILLEICGWRFRRALLSGRLWLTARAAGEAMSVTAGRAGRPWLAFAWLLLVPIYIFVLALGPRVTPFDLEAYMRFHFTKVRAQTRLFGDGYIAAAEAAGRQPNNLRALIALCPDWRPTAPPPRPAS